jgi:hypothetical protein
VGVRNQVTFLILYYPSSRLIPLLDVINIPIQVPDIVDLTEGILREIGNIVHLGLWHTLLPNAFLLTFHYYLIMMSNYNYLITRSTALVEKLLVTQVVKNFPAFYGT